MKKLIKKVNFNDIAFFKGCTTSEAKEIVIRTLYPGKEALHINDKGNPVVSVDDTIDVSHIDYKMKSCSDKFEGKSYVQYLANFNNKGTTKQALLKFSKSVSFTKALKFTGKHTILNEILNKDQYRILQQTWLLENTLYHDRFSKNAIKFILENDWSSDYLKSKGIFSDKIEAEIKLYLNEIEKKKKRNSRK